MSHCHCECEKFIGCAHICGGPLAPELEGKICFKQDCRSIIVYVSLKGLPCFAPACGNVPQTGPFGLKICCEGGVDRCYRQVDCCPLSAASCFGAFPSLIPVDGCVQQTFRVPHLKPCDILGRYAVIFQAPDGADGLNCSARLACGEIRPC